MTVSEPATGTYTIDPARSEVAFTTKHLFGTRTVTGRFSGIVGQINVARDYEQSSVSARVAVASFDTGDARRDAMVKSKTLLDADRHPNLQFEAARVVRDDSGWHLDGVLTARGSAAPLRLTVISIRCDPESIALSAEGTVDRYAHGVTALKGLAARTLRITARARASRDEHAGS